ncbi:MAG TPA: response regulator transcription factor [Opitutaceae bacterium]|nr:response regulator transcription factor [Opitutaceae bacterium]
MAAAVTENPKTQAILVIDDEAYFRRFVGQVVKKATTARVIEARDGREGVKQFEEHSPALVLLDISMPHLDGVRTLTALRKLSDKVPIVMLTSLSEEKVVEECIEQGASFFIRKDVQAASLAMALHEILTEFLHQKETPA